MFISAYIGLLEVLINTWNSCKYFLTVVRFGTIKKEVSNLKSRSRINCSFSSPFPLISDSFYIVRYCGVVRWCDKGRMQGDLELEREILIKGGHVVCTDGTFFFLNGFFFFFFFWKYQFLKIFCNLMLDRFFSISLRWFDILSIDSIRLVSVRSDKTILPTQFSFLLVIVI